MALCDKRRTFVAVTLRQQTMKKALTITLCGTLALSGCGSYAGEGAFMGSQIGSVLGSAIGGINGGPRGADIGTIVGMAGGAVAGAAIGSAADRAQQDRYERYQRDREAEYSPRGQRGQRGYSQQPGGERAADAGSGFDPTNSGDDRIDFDGGAAGEYPDGNDTFSTVKAEEVTPRELTVGQLSNIKGDYKFRFNALVEVCNATFVDRSGDGVLAAGEESQVSFDIMNRSGRPIYGLTPTVLETTGNRHVHISPSVRVESIAPGQGVRYTATVYGDRRLKDGEITLHVAVVQGDNEITSQMKEFNVPTKRK